MQGTYRVEMPEGYVDATVEMVRFPESIQLILDSGVKATQLCRALGVERKYFYHWKKGKCLPRNPLTYRTITLWANQIREGKAPELKLVSVSS